MTTTPTVNVTHDLVTHRSDVVTGFKLRPNSFQVRQANTFAGKISTGGLTHSDMDLWQVMEFTDWSHGQGCERISDDAARYLSADGGIEASIANQLTLAPMWRTTDSGFVANCFCEAGNYVFAGGNTSIRYSADGVTWADAVTGGTGLGAAVKCLERFNGDLYAALLTGNYLRCADPVGAPGTWVAAATEARCFKVWKTGLYKAIGPAIYLSTDGATWGAAINLGDPATNVLWMAVQDGLLVVGKEECAYVGNSDASAFTPLNPDIPQYTGNFAQMRANSGWLYFNILGSVERMSGLSSDAVLQLLTPSLVGDDNYGWGIPVSVAASSKDVWVLFNGAENSYPAALKYTGDGWHVAYKGAAAGTAKSIYYSRIAGRLLVNDGSTRAQRYSTLNDRPYPDYDAGAGYTIQFAHVNMSLAEIDKMCRALIVETEDCSATEKIEFYYQDDNDGTWTLFGTITANPLTTIYFNSSVGAAAAKDLWIKAIFYTGDAGKTPKVKGLYLRHLPRPDPIYAVSCDIELEDNQTELDGSTADTQTATAKLTELQDINDSKVPIQIDTLDGISRFVVMTNLGWTWQANLAYASAMTRKLIASVTFADVALPTAWVLEADWSNATGDYLIFYPFM